MSNKVIAVLAASALFFLGSCQVEDPIVPETPEPSVGVSGFTICATYGALESKAVFDEDGLGMYWTKGDVLHLVDPEGVKPTVTLDSDITDSVRTATFHTDELIAPGKYIVLYGQDGLDVEKGIAVSKDIADLNGQIRLYGNVEVSLGQTEADVVLQHLFAMLSFQFSNVPAGLDGISLGMAVAERGLKNLGEGKITSEGLVTEYSGLFLTMLGYVDGCGSENKARTLIAPVDLNNNQVIFFVTWNNGSSRSVRTFVKNGKDLQAGKAYNISLDFNDASSAVDFAKTESGASIISNYDEFLAAALLHSGNTFDLQEDIDFSGKIFLPVRVGTLIGNGHTLSGIQCNLDSCSNVGLLSEGRAVNLNVKESIFNGLNNVGAISGEGLCEGCHCESVNVMGNNNVGGLVGHANGVIQASSISGIYPVSGVDNVGGIVGYSSYSVCQCLANGTVVVSASGNMVGGIAGYAGGGVRECGFEGSVTGANTVGGVSGEGNCSKSYCIGDVNGQDVVGGVSGCSNCSDCYFIGEVKSFYTTNSGGICGAKPGATAEEDVTVTNCYSCGSVSSGYGICISPVASCKGTNLTSLEKMYVIDSHVDNCLCGPSKTFVSKLDVINGNGAYLNLCVPDNLSGCPVLAWQYKGFGSGVTIPGFEPIDWE